MSYWREFLVVKLIVGTDRTELSVVISCGQRDRHCAHTVCKYWSFIDTLVARYSEGG